MTRRRVAVAVLMALTLAASAGASDHEEGAEEGFTKQAESGTCPPTRGIVDPRQDVRRGQCLFNSRTAFGQRNPNHLFASCSGCHPGGGTDRGNHPVTITNGQGQTVTVLRQTPDLENVAYNFPWGWDGRRASIQEAARGAILSPIEMNGTIVTDDQLDALTAFLLSRSLARPRPGAIPPDLQARAPERHAEFQATLNRIAVGRQVFFGKGQCTNCHPAPFFTDHQIRTNVLSPNAEFSFGSDPGRGFISGNAAEDGQFKTPSLHHFYPSGAPFMHNGTLGTASQVFRFYEKSLGFALTSQERTGLDYWLVHCPRGPFALVPSTCFDGGAASAMDFAIGQGFTPPAFINSVGPQR